MSPIRCIAWRAFCLAIVLSWTPRVRAEGALEIQRIQDVMESWSPDQQLYVKGDLGVGREQWVQLQRWLREHGPHWTVVLLRNAAGETYHATDGRRFEGMDAVEFALGHGLANRTAFGELEHPVTGETDGAVFVLFYDERKFSYYGSDAQDRRGLGEAAWVGTLDRPAFRAMRNGERILDAVKDTVSLIHQQLEAKIAGEAAEEERIARERERAVLEARSAIERAGADVRSVEAAADRFRERFPAARGPLAQPPAEEWQRRLAAFSEDVDAPSARSILREVAGLSAEVAGFLNDYAVAEDFTTREQAVREALVDLQGAPGDVGRPAMEQATEQLRQSRAALEEGSRASRELFAQAEAAIAQGRQAIAGEKERLAREAARRKLVRRTALAVSVVFLALIALGLLILNRRRRAVRDQAWAALAAREKAVRDAMDRVLQLFSRTSELLGTRESVAQRGYAGETAGLTDRTFRGVDDLLMMSREVERVMREARELIHPQELAVRLWNLFDATRYELGVNRISGEPLRFDRSGGLPSIVAAELADAAQASNEQPSAVSDDAETVTLTFEKVFDAFRQRGDDVSSALDTIESCLLQVNDRLRQLRDQIDAAELVEKERAAATRVDGLFAVPNFFDQLLPSVEQDFDEADAMAGSDPVRAMREPLAAGDRKIAEALRLADELQRARSELLPVLSDVSPELLQMGYATDWIDERLAALGEWANELYAQACEHTAREGINRWGEEVDAMRENTRACLDHALLLQDDLRPAVHQLRRSIQTLRRQISESLGIALEAALSEPIADPDRRHAAAQEQAAAAAAALQVGKAKEAAEAIAQSQRELAAGQQILDDAREVLELFPERREECHRQVARARETLAEVRGEIGEATGNYSPAALLLRAARPDYPDPNANLESCQQLAVERLNASQAGIDAAAEHYAQGRLLAAQEALFDASENTAAAEQLVGETRQHLTMLHERVAENTSRLQTQNRQLQRLQQRLDEIPISRATIRYAGEVQEQLRTVETARQGSRDPFQVARQLEELQEKLDHGEGLMEADIRAHAAAERAVQGAAEALAAGQELIRQSQQDTIPDSVTTESCVREIESLGSQLQMIRRRLRAPHDDWREVHDDATQITGTIRMSVERLAGDLDKARQATRMLERTAEQVFRATRWTGSYGVQISGSSGADYLQEARRRLSVGDYDRMMELARTAALAAEQAILHAEREVARRRRAEERRREESRRKQMQRSIQIGGGISGGAGRITFGGGASRSSGSSPSSSRGSSSGFSRSGW